MRKYKNTTAVIGRVSLWRRYTLTSDIVQPIAFSANGTHAVYATDGTHAYGIPNLNLPLGFIQDYTDEGPLWDPVLFAYWYSYDNASNIFTAYNSE